MAKMVRPAPEDPLLVLMHRVLQQKSVPPAGWRAFDAAYRQIFSATDGEGDDHGGGEWCPMASADADPPAADGGAAEGDGAGEGPLIIAIDGRCASGKTTLSASLAARFPLQVIHMDDFFLRPEQRTPGRYAEPGGNVDRERFLETVLRPLATGRSVVYRRMDCRTLTLTAPIWLPPKPLVLVEGAYAAHPVLQPYYHLTVMMSVPPAVQQARIAARNGGQTEGTGTVAAFIDRWIPMEEAYIEGTRLAARCDIEVHAHTCPWTVHRR